MTYIVGIIENDSVSLLSDTVVTYGEKQSTFKPKRSQFGENLNRRQTSDSLKFFKVAKSVVATFTSNNSLSVLEFFENLSSEWNPDLPDIEQIRAKLPICNLKETAILFSVIDDLGPKLLVFENLNSSDYSPDCFYELEYDQHYISFGSPTELHGFRKSSEDVIERVDEIENLNSIDRLALYCGLHQKLGIENHIISTGAGGVFTGCNLSTDGIKWTPQMMYNIFEFKSNNSKFERVKINMVKISSASELGFAYFSNAGSSNKGKFDHSFKFSYIPTPTIYHSESDKVKFKNRLLERRRYNLDDKERELKFEKPEYVFNFIVGDIFKRVKFNNNTVVIVVKYSSAEQRVIKLSSYEDDYFQVDMKMKELEKLLSQDIEENLFHLIGF